MKLCKDCRFYEESEFFKGVAGDCHRYPPTLTSPLCESKGWPAIVVQRPTTSVDGWCGEWSRRDDG